MEEKQFYNASKILSLKDLDNLEPTIFLITSNRCAGKTTYFLKKFLEDFKKTGEKFILIYRYSYELNACENIFSDVLSIYPQFGQDMESTSYARGLFYELFLDKKSCGFAVSMSNPDSLKKYSPVFKDCTQALLDEFQVENGKYLQRETDKLQSLLVTVSRGGGKQYKEVKLYLLSNMVTIMNPYYITFGIHKRLRENTKFLRGHGWVAEFNINESARKGLAESAIARAFQNSDYMNMSSESVYLYDSKAFVKNVKGRNRYLFSIRHDNRLYGVREFFDENLLVVSKKVDKNCQNIMTFQTKDHDTSTLLVDRYSFYVKLMKDAFKRGYLRFDDVETKNVVFDILGVDIYH